MKKMSMRMLVVAASAVWAMVAAPAGAWACEGGGVLVDKDCHEIASVSGSNVLKREGTGRLHVYNTDGSEQEGLVQMSFSYDTPTVEWASTGGTLRFDEVNTRAGIVVGDLSASDTRLFMAGGNVVGMPDLRNTSGTLTVQTSPRLSQGGTLTLGRATSSVNVGKLQLEENDMRATDVGGVVASGGVIIASGAMEIGAGATVAGDVRAGQIRAQGGLVAPSINAAGGDVSARGAVVGTGWVEPARSSMPRVDVVIEGGAHAVDGANGAGEHLVVGNGPIDGGVVVGDAACGGVE